MPVFITTNTNYSLILLVCLIHPVAWCDYAPRCNHRHHDHQDSPGSVRERKWV